MDTVHVHVSQADAALLVLNAARGEFEAGLAGQTREHLLLARHEWRVADNTGGGVALRSVVLMPCTACATCASANVRVARGGGGVTCPPSCRAFGVSQLLVAVNQATL